MGRSSRKKSRLDGPAHPSGADSQRLKSAAAAEPQADSAVPRPRPTTRQKLYLGVSVAAFAAWLAFLLWMALRH
jgi:hypothetical protein